MKSKATLICAFALLSGASANAAVLAPTGATVSSSFQASNNATMLLNDTVLSASTTLTGDTGGFNNWMTANVAGGSWAILDLGANYDLSSLYLWNGDQTSITNRGVSNFDLLVSSSASASVLGDFTLMLDNQAATQSVSAGANAAQTFNFNATNVRKVMIFVNDNFSTTENYTNIREVRFEGVTAVPEPSTYGLMGVGALAFAFVRRRKRNA